MEVLYLEVTFKICMKWLVIKNFMNVLMCEQFDTNCSIIKTTLRLSLCKKLENPKYYATP